MNIAKMVKVFELFAIFFAALYNKNTKKTIILRLSHEFLLSNY